MISTILDPPSTSPTRPEARISRAFSGAVGLTFRGGIIENCRRFRFIGSGYDAMPKEQDRQFDIATARQCAGPMAALTDPLVRVTHIIGATQVLKSMNGDAWVLYSIEHERLPFLVLFEDDGKADLFCGRRLMDTVRNHSHIARMLDDTKKESRHNVTGTWIKFLGFELLVAGLNEGNVSTLSWPRVWISEAWQHPHDGMLGKAFKRTDRYPNTFKILNESQASLSGTDLHNAVLKARPVPLVWRCPACDGEQTWEWHHWSYERPSDFVPRPQKRISTATIGDELALISAPEPRPGTYAGMRFPDDNGKLTIEERARRAYWECIHCGHRIHDTKVERMQVCETYTQNYKSAVSNQQSVADSENPQSAIHNPQSREVCFTIPFEAAWDNRFEKTVQNFLIAKRSKEQGNDVPLQDWFLSERAFFYQKGQTTAQELKPAVGSYNPQDQIPNQHSVNMLVDCQKALDAGPDDDRMGSFWVIVEAVDKFGNSWDLFRGFLTSKDEVVALQKRFKIPNRRVCIDGRKWTPTIMQWAAENYEWEDAAWLGRKYRRRATWMIFLGDDAAYYKWGKVAKPYSQPHQHDINILENSRPIKVAVFTYLWSNTAIKDQLSEILIGGEGKVKIQTLTRAQLDAPTRDREKGDLTYDRQINAEYRSIKRGKPWWDKKQNRPNHYWDCRCEGLVRKQMDGLAGGVIDTSAVGQPGTGESVES